MRKKILNYLTPLIFLFVHKASMGQPNIVLVTLDDWRYLAGTYGHSEIQTPTIDALAVEGARFTQAYTSHALCTPARTALVTGKRAETNGVTGYRDHFRDTIPDTVTMGQKFMENGYHVVGFGKTYLHWRDDASWSEPVMVPSTDYGVPIYALPENIADQMDAINQGLQFQGTGWWAGSDTWFNPTAPYEAADVPDNFYYDGKIADLAIDRIASLQSTQPFFIQLGFFGPHYPHIAPQSYFDMYPLSSIEVPDRSHPINMWSGATNNNAPSSDTELKKWIQAYYAQVTYVDSQLGRVIQALKDNGLYDDSIILITSDHGYHLGERSHWHKSTNFDVDLRVPLLIKCPGKPLGNTAIDAMVELVDIYPTLCELADIPIDPLLEGFSFAPLLTHHTLPWKTAIFHERIRNGYYGKAIRTENYRLVQWVKGNTTIEELYDLSLDGWPHEQRNRVNDAEYADILNSLRNDLQTGWQGALPQIAFTDADSDGLTDLDEIKRGTDINLRDSDSDGMWDGMEVYWNFDPTTANPFTKLQLDEHGSMSWMTGFEPQEGYSLGSVDAQHQWTGTPHALVTDNASYGSSRQSLTLLQGETASSEIFVASGDARQVHVSLKGKLAPGDVPPISSIQESTTAVFMMDKDNYLRAYDSTSGTWLQSTQTYTPDIWRRYDTTLDYENRRWSLSVDGVLLFQDIGFLSNDTQQLTRIKISQLTNTNDTDAYVDEISVSNTPQSEEVSNYQFWALAQLGSAHNTESFTISDTDTDRLTNLMEYALDTDPLTYSDAPFVSGVSELGDIFFVEYRDTMSLIQVEESTTLDGDWIPAVGSLDDLGNGHYRYNVPLNSRNALFLRLNATLP